MPSGSTESVLEALRTFAQSVHEKLGIQGGSDVWPEDQLKPPVDALITSVANAMGRVAVVRTEAPRPAGSSEDSGSRVDVAVHIGSSAIASVLTGHIELKAPSKSGDPRKLKSAADKAQWKKFSKLPNLLYTNGREWTLQRSGSQIGQLIKLSGDPVVEGAAAVSLEDAQDFELLIRTFFAWEPIVPHSSRQIAELLAPLCRLLRSEALDALKRDDSALTSLAHEMRKYLFPNATNEVVADAYAQTFTYALLIARFEGANPLSIDTAEHSLRDGYGLLSEVLHLLDTQAARQEVQTSTDLLLRVIGQVKPNEIVAAHGTNPWLYFYEEFLAAYDPALRKKVGAYYTPVEVVKAQVAFVRELLIKKFGKATAFAHPDVVTLDPAVGTGTYPLGILESVIENVPSHAAGSTIGLLQQASQNLFGIEYLIGPYSVAHLRLSRYLAENGVPTTEDNPVKVLLADTLASHEEDEQAMLPGVFGYEEILQEREVARELKVDTRVVVCIGNPPYLRGKKTDAGASLGGWVSMRRRPINGQKVRDPLTRRMVKDRGEVGIIKDFIDPAVASGHGGDLKNLYNAYVYFWRWALWKVFEQEFEDVGEGGVVSFITASSYLRGPGFVGMRQHMRATMDEIWIVDLGGDNKGGRKTENVFAIETPVSILTGVRYGEPDPSTPAKVHYVSFADFTATQKRAMLAKLAGITDPQLNWRDGMNGWQEPFLPAADEEYLSWPSITELFPVHVSGVQMFRSWPIGETKEVLEARWSELVRPLPLDRLSESSTENKRRLRDRRSGLFSESRDRKVDKAYPDLFGSGPSAPITDLTASTPPVIRPYAFRAFDRQYVLADARVGDYLRPSLWKIHSASQRYLTSMLTEVLGSGPAAVVARDVPDYHHFRGSFGGRHVVPLWKDAAATEPNVATGLLAALSDRLGTTLEASDLFDYVYGLLSTSAFVETFWEPLTIPGAHIPITSDRDLFELVRDHGKALVHLHSVDLFDLDVQSTSNPGRARYSRAIPADEYPDGFSYDAASETLRIGTGEYTFVAPEVWEYTVSGLAIVDSWLGYRKFNRAGKSGSALDDIRPKSWPDPTGEQLLRLLWVLEQTIAFSAKGARLLERVLGSNLVTRVDLPTASPDGESTLRDGDGDGEEQEDDEGAV